MPRLLIVIASTRSGRVGLPVAQWFAPLKNAIDFLHNEWKYKPLGLVSYGGVSAGTSRFRWSLSLVP